MRKLESKMSEKKTNKIAGTKRSSINPKAIRFNHVDINRLEDFKKRLCDISGSDSCPDSTAMRALLAISVQLSDDELARVII